MILSFFVYDKRRINKEKLETVDNLKEEQQLDRKEKKARIK
ncbi:hypothetical protein CAMA108575_03285 [Catellicoccus marimammalium]